MRPTLIIGAFLTALLAVPAHSQETDSAARKVGGGLNAGLKQTFLDIEGQRECANCPASPLDYDTEGVNIYEIFGEITAWGGAVIEFGTEQPFKKSDRQDELLRAQKADETSYEKYGAAFISDPLADRYIQGRDLRSQILKRLLSIKFVRSRERFFGSVKTNSEAVFLPRGAAIDYAGLTFINPTNLAAGTELTFKTVYTDTELSFCLATVNMKGMYVADGDLRLGYYWASWERLSDTQISGVSAVPVIYEADFRTQGILIAFESKDRTSPGLNVDLAAKIGINDRIDSAIDWSRLTNQEVDTQTMMLKLGLWYNHYFKKATKEGWSMAAGGSVDLRETNVRTGSSAVAQDVPVNQNRDLILKFALSAGTRF